MFEQLKVVVTGGAGFIGSHFVSRLIKNYPEYRVVVYDALTYAGNLNNIAKALESGRASFVHGNICDAASVDACLRDADMVVNFAAETHVDRSIVDPDSFLRTDVLGTHVILETVRRHSVSRFLHVSTDEVYGSVTEGASVESAPFSPSSPYSASKASAELLIQAYRKTYGITALVTRGSNTYGPNQYPEKLIPFFITRLLKGESVPLYGDGLQTRDYLHVDDHCAGIDIVLHSGEPGEAYNVGGGHRETNIDVALQLIKLLGKSEDRLQHIADRPGHDTGYSIDTRKLRALGYLPQHSFDIGLEQTVKWYADNTEWWESALDRERSQGDFAASWYASLSEPKS